MKVRRFFGKSLGGLTIIMALSTGCMEKSLPPKEQAFQSAPPSTAEQAGKPPAGVRKDIYRLCLDASREIEHYVFDKASINQEVMQTTIKQLNNYTHPDEFAKAPSSSLSDEEKRMINSTLSMINASSNEKWNDFFVTYTDLGQQLPLKRKPVHDKQMILDSLIYEDFVEQIYHRGSLNYTKGESNAAQSKVAMLKQTMSVEIVNITPSNQDPRRVKVTYTVKGDEPSTVIMEWLPRDVYEYEVVERERKPAKPEATTNPPDQFLKVTAQQASVRESLSTKSEVIYVAARGELLEFTGRYSQEVYTGRKMYVVKIGDKFGYVSSTEAEEQLSP